MFSQADPYLLLPCLLLLGSAIIMFIYHWLLYLHYNDKLIRRYCFYLFAISLYLTLDIYARISPGHVSVKTNLIISAVSIIVILGYASFLMGTVIAWEKKYKTLFLSWKIVSVTGIIYISFCLGSALFNIRVDNIFSVVSVQVLRTLFVIIGIWAMVIFFPLLNDRFMRWIKWGAFIYLFFMGMVMVTILLIPTHRLFGLSAMHFVYLGTFFDVVFFSLAMSYKIKDSFYKVTEVKNRLSKDLHDDIGASLSSIQIYSSVAEKAINEDIEKTKSILKQIRQNAGKVMEDMNDIVWAMNTNQKDEMSFSGRIKNYGYELLSQKNIDCVYRIDIKAEQKLLKPESRKNILLIVKEALNNMAKYSEASHAEVYIGIEKNNFLVVITDNGKGFSVKNTLKGNGLNNISGRMALLGGSFEIISSPGKGTIIRCIIPLTSISDNW